ncbi:MAG TPA: LysE family translocator [Tahibacter sp.]|nr:LysE family translocator [Tahibacter sp.]
MDVLHLWIFALALAVAGITPGPSVIAVVSRVLGRGPVGAPMLCLGLVIGDLVWLSAAAFGVAALAQLYAPVFLAIRYAGAAFLVYLAWKLWQSHGDAPDIAVPAASGDGVRLVATGLSMALGNPKVMLFYLALLPALIDLDAIRAIDFLVLSVVTVCVVSGVLTFYVMLASRARRLLQSPRALRAVNRFSGAMMLGCAIVLIAAR